MAEPLSLSDLHSIVDADDEILHHSAASEYFSSIPKSSQVVVSPLHAAAAAPTVGSGAKEPSIKSRQSVADDVHCLQQSLMATMSQIKQVCPPHPHSVCV